MSRLRRATLPVLILILLGAGLAAVAVPTSSSSAAPDRPNVLVLVVVVVTDDQRLETIKEMPQTLAWLRGNGVVYSNAIASTPLCCPARSTLLTGKYTHNHGVRTISDAVKLDPTETLPAELQKAGYRTGAVGKFLNEWPLCDQDPPSFDRFAIFGGGYDGLGLRVDSTTITSTPGELAPASYCKPGPELNLRLTGYTTHTVSDYGRHFLDQFDAQDDTSPCPGRRH